MEQSVHREPRTGRNVDRDIDRCRQNGAIVHVRAPKPAAWIEQIWADGVDPAIVRSQQPACTNDREKISKEMPGPCCDTVHGPEIEVRIVPGVNTKIMETTGGTTAVSFLE